MQKTCGPRKALIVKLESRQQSRGGRWSLGASSPDNHYDVGQRVGRLSDFGQSVGSSAGASARILITELGFTVLRLVRKKAPPPLSMRVIARSIVAVLVGVFFLIACITALIALLALAIAGVAGLVWALINTDWLIRVLLPHGRLLATVSYFLYSAIPLVAFLLTMWRGRPTESAAAALAAICLFFLGGIAFSVGRVAFVMWRDAKAQVDPVKQIQLHSSILLILLCSGAIAYFWKRLSKFWYGIGEIALSTATTWLLVQNAVSLLPKIEMQHLIGIFASVYVFSRGIGNAVEGLEERGHRSDGQRSLILEFKKAIRFYLYRDAIDSIRHNEQPPGTRTLQKGL